MYWKEVVIVVLLLLILLVYYASVQEMKRLEKVHNLYEALVIYTSIFRDFANVITDTYLTTSGVVTETYMTSLVLPKTTDYMMTILDSLPCVKQVSIKKLTVSFNSLIMNYVIGYVKFRNTTDNNGVKMPTGNVALEAWRSLGDELSNCADAKVFFLNSWDTVFSNLRSELNAIMDKDISSSIGFEQGRYTALYSIADVMYPSSVFG